MYFATLLDKNYITRASVLIDSLKLQMKNNLSRIFILCLDEAVYEYFLNTSQITVIKLEKFESEFIELSKVKSSRKYVEYIFTLSPFLPLYILKNYDNVDRITTLDADLFFFSSPFPFISQLGNDKIGITPHDFPEELIHLERWGKFNVSFQSFPRTKEGLNCLNKWASDCISYCGDDIDEIGRFADQKYLDSWQTSFSNIFVFNGPFIGLAPWNIKKYRFSWKNNSPLYLGKDVVFYHFHEVRFKSNYHITVGLNKYGNSDYNKSIRKIYNLYFRRLINNGHVSDTGMVRNNTNIKSIISDILDTPLFIKIWRNSFYLNLNKYAKIFSKF